jgi:hypothetical protein
MRTRAVRVLAAFGAVVVTIGALSVALDAQSKRQPAAKPAAAPPASARMPEVIVGGIQVAKVVVAEDDWSAKPFNSGNGTKIVLWIKMPPGVGLIEIDEDASLLEVFGDDKGTDLGGKYDSFPDEFKDGTGATMEITSDALPNVDSTTLLARGTLAMNVATGSKPQKVANVKIENEKTFKLGQVTMTLAEVETEGEELKFTVKLPRQTMNGIKDVKFYDAKAQALEGRRTSSGYMNDEAEIGFAVKTALKTLTVEFEMWQGLQDIKVPFNVKSGIGLVR